MNVYERALGILDERGWAQGHYTDREGRVCLAQAVDLASQEVKVSRIAAYARLSKFAEVQGLTGVAGARTLMSFNDNPGTSEEDVRLLLKRAAVELPA